MTTELKSCVIPNFSEKDFKIEVTKVGPDMSRFSAEEKKFFCEAANKRTIWTISYNTPKTRDEADPLMRVRTQVISNRCRLPVKYLSPDKEYNRYIVQKCPTRGDHDDIEQAAYTASHMNPGFDNVIRTILIDQNIPIGTIFEIDVAVPYECEEHKFFRSASLKPVSKIESPLAFDPNHHIGMIHIGGRYRGKFTVENLDLKLWDSMQLFGFEIKDNQPNGKSSFSIWSYDFLHIDINWILKEVIKIADPITIPTLKLWLSMCEKLK